MNINCKFYEIMIPIQYIKSKPHFTQMERLKREMRGNDNTQKECAEIAKELYNLHHSTTATHTDIANEYHRLIECKRLHADA